MNLEGKTVLFLGSSVTYGAAAKGKSFADMMTEYGCTVVKEAVSGTTLVDNGPDSYVSRMKTMDQNIKADLFVCQLSTNDASKGLPLGELDGSMDTSTIAGAIEYIIDYAKKTWNCPVAFYTNPRYDSEPYARMVALLKQCDVEIIDLWGDEAFNQITDEQRARYMDDAIHPTYEGYHEWWLPVFVQAVERMCK